ncbi:hypothetical protein AAFC00_001779 [Neodothiora populina]|uniref:PWI domain-containing protein n=1 Tax=Neodothiora populina TaxID=2781224 RepID=A0ABR3PQ40_9PEZI
MNRITTNVDQKLLRTTKFPVEFSQKVDTSKIHIPVIKNWAAGEVSKILNYEDDVVIGLLFDLLEGSKYPDIKSLQIQLTGFLGKDAAPFCKELWTLCLDAQKSDTGIPKQLVEAKKAELIQEKIESERAAENARRRREEERARERELEDIRYRERADRGRGRGGPRRDYDRRPPRDYSRSPPPRHHRMMPPAPRNADTYVPGQESPRRAERRYRSRTRSPRRPPLGRNDQPSPKRRRVNSRSPSYSPPPRGSRRDAERRNDYSPRPRRRSSPPYRESSRSRSRSRTQRPRRDRRRHSRSRSARRGLDDEDRAIRPRRRRSSSSLDRTRDVRIDKSKDRAPVGKALQSPSCADRRQSVTVSPDARRSSPKPSAEKPTSPDVATKQRAENTAAPGLATDEADHTKADAAT